MKKPIAIIFNDIHLKTGNEQETLDAVDYMIKVAKDKDIKNLIFAGDLFDSRSFQRLKTLKTFERILSKFLVNGLHSHFIPGNHDKSIYKDKESFLDSFKWFPNFNLYDDVSDIGISGIDIVITMIPFFSDDILIPKLEEHTGGDILISHFEMAGSTHLGMTSEKSTINEKLLSKWNKTYLGHYHNYHEITDNIIHLPSFRPQSFGEDNTKGFALLYDDLSYELIKGRFREFNKVSIDLDNTNTSEIKELIKTHKNSSDVVRFEFTGTDANLKALDKSIFQDTGIDIKLKYTAKYDFDEDSLKPEPINKYNKAQVKDLFKKFCDDKGLDVNKGTILLEEFLNKK